MVFVEIDSVMMLTTSVTATTGMLTVLANTTMTMTHMASEFSSLTESGRLQIDGK